MEVEDGSESEQISDSFVCAVCLDLIYKPIVLACGHISCFWCVHKSMSFRRESHCPICRHAYQHFPAISKMLHFLLYKIYPITYKRRGNQILEMEKQMLDFSPDLGSPVASEKPDFVCTEGQSSTTRLQHSSSVVSISVTDVLCAACKQMLYRPVALNCGHLYCEVCIVIPATGKLRCQVCECPHPGGCPKVCLVLDHFLEEQFASEYAERKGTTQLKQIQYQTGIPTMDASEKGSPSSFPKDENFYQWLTDNVARFHSGVGCDYCGMVPIIGDRYRCQDCTEKIGFDLCGDCYHTSSKLPGRFNQQHTPEHRLKKIQPQLTYSPFRRYLPFFQSVPYASPTTPENSISSNDVEDGSVSPNSLSDQTQDQSGDQSPL